MKFWRLHRPGYRVLKTVIATTLTLLVCSRFSKMSPVLALMGAYCAMGRTIRESWTGCLNQMVGVLVGSVFGFLLLHVLPDPPALVIGLSLFAVIGLCNLLHVSYAVFLSSVIFISVCSGASQLPDILARVRDVSIGLAFGLAVNIFVHPYANERQVLALLEKLREESLRALREITSFLQEGAFNVSYVSLAKVGNLLLNTAGVEDFTELRLNGQAANVSLADEEIAVAGAVTLEVMP